MNKFIKPRYIIAAFFLLVVVIVEISLRFAYYEQLKLRSYPLIYKSDSLLGYTYIPGAQAEICIPGISKKFTINENGYYGKPFKKEKNGKFRIAIIGTSEACGIWLNSDSTFCYILQQMLDSQHLNAEVLNFSMDGKMRDLNNINLINTDVINYQPDLVLLTVSLPFIKGSFCRTVYKDYVLNYNGTSSASLKWCKAKIDYIESHRALKLIYKVSYIARAVCRYYMYHYTSNYALNAKVFVEKRIQAPDIRLIPYSLDKSLDLIKSTQKKLNAINCDFAIYYYTGNKFCEQVLDSSNVKTISLEIEGINSMCSGVDGHYNEQAQQIIAERFFEKLHKVNGRIIIQ